MMVMMAVLGVAAFVAAVCLGIAANQIRLGTQEAPARPDGECVHDWTLWSQPEDGTVTLASWYGDNIHRPALVQSKTCLKCNMHERRIC